MEWLNSVYICLLSVGGKDPGLKCSFFLKVYKILPVIPLIPAVKFLGYSLLL